MDQARPYSVSDVIGAGSFPAVFANLIFKNPQVTALKLKAEAAAKAEGIVFDRYAGLMGVVIGHNDPMVLVRHFHPHPWSEPDPIPPTESLDEASEFYDPWPLELAAYYEELNRRAQTLFEFLQSGSLIAHGHTENGQAVDIARSVWLHGNFYIHAYQGDIFEGGFEFLERRWVGVSFRLGNPIRGLNLGFDNAAVRLRKAPKSEAVAKAIREAGIDLKNTKLAPKQIATEVLPFLNDPPRSEEQILALKTLISRLVKRAR